jgi:hypothetical protein
MAVEQAYAATIAQRRTGNGTLHAEDRQATEAIVKGLSLKPPRTSGTSAMRAWEM